MLALLQDQQLFPSHLWLEVITSNGLQVVKIKDINLCERISCNLQLSGPHWLHLGPAVVSGGGLGISAEASAAALTW